MKMKLDEISVSSFITFGEMNQVRGGEGYTITTAYETDRNVCTGALLCGPDSNACGDC